ncbi:PH domain-containing protein [Lentzea sp. NBRC 105346]|uniref:PH domain-containing protein n=1 Tax=Lentzea sp. NBRC 105346 TaxID=3032205 RepID=UPI002555B56C|nr:PH domain-containing protein [Lentzea sp. NBRC 105346]
MAICITPVAWLAPGTQALYVVPLGLAWWVLRNRTTVDPEKLLVRTTFGSTVLPWTDVKSIRVAQKGWLAAVRTDDSEVKLPAVRFIHLPALSLVSGGRVPDPTAEPDAEVTEEPVSSEE